MENPAVKTILIRLMKKIDGREIARNLAFPFQVEAGVDMTNAKSAYMLFHPVESVEM